MAWYINSGVSHHFTSHLNNLSNPVTYQGNEQVLVGKAKSIDIRNIGTVSIPAHSKFLKSKHDLHSPEITKKII